MADLELVLEMLRRMQSDLREVKETLREVVRRLGHLEQTVAQIPGIQAEHSVRVDRLAERVERIESRLDLRE